MLRKFLAHLEQSPRLQGTEFLTNLRTKITAKITRTDRYKEAVKSLCFVAGTLVHTSTGTVPIEQITIGDQVLSRNEFTQELSYKPVTELFVTQPSQLTTMLVTNSKGVTEVIECTPQHRFYVPADGEFIEAGLLSSETELIDAQNNSIFINQISTRKITKDKELVTYNFEVDDFHTYFVGNTALWNHNEGLDCKEAEFLFYSLWESFEENGDTIEKAAKKAFEEFLSLPEVKKLKAGDHFTKVFPGSMRALVNYGETYNFTDLKRLLRGKLQERNYYSEVDTKKRRFWILQGTSFGVHHGGPRYVQELMGIAKNNWDDIPAIVMKESDHKAFHSILNKYVPENIKSRDVLFDYLDNELELSTNEKNEYMVRALEKAYQEFSSKANDGSLNHYNTFMEQVREKLRTKATLEESLRTVDIREI